MAMGTYGSGTQLEPEWYAPGAAEDPRTRERMLMRLKSLRAAAAQRLGADASTPDQPGVAKDIYPFNKYFERARQDEDLQDLERLSEGRPLPNVEIGGMVSPGGQGLRAGQTTAQAAGQPLELIGGPFSQFANADELQRSLAGVAQQRIAQPTRTARPRSVGGMRM